jgi:hypothetical protein
MSTTNAKSGSKPQFNFNFADLEEKDSEDSNLRKNGTSNGMSDADKVEVDDDMQINIPDDLQV